MSITADTKKDKEVKRGDEEIYNETLKLIKDIIEKQGKYEFVEKQNISGSSFFGPNNTRLLKLIKLKSGYRLELNVPVDKVEGLVVLTDEEAKAKHMGTCRWIYYGDDEKDLKQLVTQAVQRFKPVEKEEAKGRENESRQKAAMESGDKKPVKGEE